MATKQKKVIDFCLDEDGFFGVTAVSLVEFPAIEENWVALKKQGAAIQMKAVDGERRMLYGPALIPDKEILRIDEKTGEEYFIRFPKPTIVQASQLFFKKNQHQNTTLEHEFATTGCSIVESWIIEGEQDKSRQFGYDLPVGTWFIGMSVDNDQVWEEVKAGTFKGFSIEGMFAQLGAQMKDEHELISEVERIIAEIV